MNYEITVEAYADAEGELGTEGYGCVLHEQRVRVNASDSIEAFDLAADLAAEIILVETGKVMTSFSWVDHKTIVTDDNSWQVQIYYMYNGTWACTIDVLGNEIWSGPQKTYGDLITLLDNLTDTWELK